MNPGDTLVARCAMINDLDHTVYTGPRDSDEMCVYYVMYYVENYGEELTSDQVPLNKKHESIVNNEQISNRMFK